MTHLIAVQGVKAQPVKGKLMLTTVSLLPSIRIGELVRGAFDPSIALVSRSLIVQPGQSEQDVQQQTADQMRESQVAAAAVALKYLGYKVDIKYTGIRIIGIQESAPAAAVLRPGDLISTVDGQPVRRPPELVSAIHRHSIGSSVKLRVVRGANSFTATVKLIPSPRNARDPAIGVIIDSVPQVKLPLAISINAQGIGGPSAGLMFAVGIVDLLNRSDLTRGRRIAGTGEIELDGTVGPVGGIRQKMEGARRAGAKLFLAPLPELREACQAGAGLTVIGVSNLSEAVRALQGAKLPANRRCK